MEKTIQQVLKEELASLEAQIFYLTEKKEVIIMTLSYYKDEVKLQEDTKSKQVSKAKITNKQKSNKNSSSGQSKFSHVLLNIFSAKPEIPYTSEELVLLMNKEIDAGRCKPSKKDMSSAVSAYIWNFKKRGIVIKQGDGYKYSGKVVKTNVIIPKIDEFDEAILEIIKGTKEINPHALMHDLRLSHNYLEISKNLNGSLSECLQKRLDDLTNNNIITNHNNHYSINPKSNL